MWKVLVGLEGVAWLTKAPLAGPLASMGARCGSECLRTREKMAAWASVNRLTHRTWYSIWRQGPRRINSLRPKGASKN